MPMDKVDPELVREVIDIAKERVADRYTKKLKNATIESLYAEWAQEAMKALYERHEEMTGFPTLATHYQSEIRRALRSDIDAFLKHCPL